MTWEIGCLIIVQLHNAAAAIVMMVSVVNVGIYIIENAQPIYKKPCILLKKNLDLSLGEYEDNEVLHS